MMGQDEGIVQEMTMTAIAIDMPCCHAASAGALARGVDSAACGRGYWYGYFMTGVPAAMSD